MELTQLRHFLKVAERESITHACTELAITQPALSRSIAKLEAELGQPLLERQTRRVVLTDAGRLFFERATQILALVNDTVAELTDNGETGRIRVGAIPTIAPYFLPTVLRQFRDACPQAHVVAHEETTDRLLHRCHQGEVDIAILAAPISAQHLQTEVLFSEELLLVLPAQHPLARKRQITLEDVRQEPMVLLDETHCLSDTIVTFCRQRAFHPVTVEHTSQLTTVEELVALGHGISLIPQMARQLDTSDRRIYRSLSQPVPTRKILLAWNPYRFQSRLMARFQDCVRSVATNWNTRQPKK
ncbi:LysR family transcriptional regulator [bacterium]|nr:LysR family transcriptional regulator [bacterium]